MFIVLVVHLHYRAGMGNRYGLEIVLGIVLLFPICLGKSISLCRPTWIFCCSLLHLSGCFVFIIYAIKKLSLRFVAAIKLRLLQRNEINK